MDSRTEKRAIADTNAKRFALKFWTAFDQYVFKDENEFSMRFHRNIPPTYSVYRIHNRFRGVHTNLCFDTRRGVCIARFCMIGNPRSIENSSRLFDTIYPIKDKIEKAYGRRLIWRRMDDKESSYVEDEIHCDFENSDTWDSVFEWYKNATVKFDDIMLSALRENERMSNINKLLKAESV